MSRAYTNHSINLEFKNVDINEIITALALHINNGYKISNWCVESSYSDGCDVNVELSKAVRFA